MGKPIFGVTFKLAAVALFTYSIYHMFTSLLNCYLLIWSFLLCFSTVSQVCFVHCRFLSPYLYLYVSFTVELFLYNVNCLFCFCFSTLCCSLLLCFCTVSTIYVVHCCLFLHSIIYLCCSLLFVSPQYQLFMLFTAVCFSTVSTINMLFSAALFLHSINYLWCSLLL